MDVVSACCCCCCSCCCVKRCCYPVTQRGTHRPTAVKSCCCCSLLPPSPLLPPSSSSSLPPPQSTMCTQAHTHMNGLQPFLPRKAAFVGWHGQTNPTHRNLGSPCHTFPNINVGCQDSPSGRMAGCPTRRGATLHSHRSPSFPPPPLASRPLLLPLLFSPLLISQRASQEKRERSHFSPSSRRSPKQGEEEEN